MAKIELSDISSGYNLSKVNKNFQKIEDALNDEVLYRDNPVGEDNALQTNIDANNKRILNLPDPVSASEPIRKQEWDQTVGLAEQYRDEAEDLKDETEDLRDDVIDLLDQLSPVNYRGDYNTGILYQKYDAVFDEAEVLSSPGAWYIATQSFTSSDIASDVSSGYLQIYREKSVIQFPTIASLQGQVFTEGQQVSVAMYHNITDLSGGGLFVWTTGRHNGGTFIDTSRTFPTDWNDQAQLTTWFADSGSDAAGFDRIADNHVNIKWFGAKGDSFLTPGAEVASGVGNGTDDTKSIKKAYEVLVTGGTVSRDLILPHGVYRITESINLLSADYSRWLGEGGHYTSTKILVDLDGDGFTCTSGEATASIYNLTMQSADRTVYPNSNGLFIRTAAVEMRISNCSFLDFGNVGARIDSGFSCYIDHCLFAANYNQGLVINGGAGNIIVKPILQDNLGTAINLQGTAHTLVSPFFESNCKRNDPAGENSTFRNLYIADSQSQVLGGTLNTWPADNKTPIENAGQEVTIMNLNVISISGSVPSWLEMTGSFSSVRLLGCRGFKDKITGNTSGVMLESVRSPGFFKNDLLLGRYSISDNISKTWCNFNGTLSSPITIRQGVNVTDVTKIGTGVYTLNFTNSLDTSTYSVSANAGGSSTNVYVSYGAKSATSLTVYIRDDSGALVDTSDVSVEIKEVTPV